MDDVYRTIRHPATHEIKVKGSRFIGECESAGNADEATAVLERIRKREHAATHHCFAYTVGLFDEAEFKYSDDGEPSGTAGRPIYDVITGRELSNVIVVVTRYFGGTKLGTGGLSRAYGDAARGVLESAGRVENYVTRTLRVGIEFSLYDQLLRLLARHEARQVDAEFTDHVILLVRVRQSRAGRLIEDITQLSGGKAAIERQADQSED